MRASMCGQAARLPRRGQSDRDRGGSRTADHLPHPIRLYSAKAFFASRSVFAFPDGLSAATLLRRSQVRWRACRFNSLASTVARCSCWRCRCRAPTSSRLLAWRSSPYFPACWRSSTRSLRSIAAALGAARLAAFGFDVAVVVTTVDVGGAVEVRVVVVAPQPVRIRAAAAVAHHRTAGGAYRPCGAAASWRPYAARTPDGGSRPREWLHEAGFAPADMRASMPRIVADPFSHPRGH